LLAQLSIANFVDLDSDNDTISDFIEAQPTTASNYTAVDNTDADSDGLTVNVDADDSAAGTGGDFSSPDFLILIQIMTQSVISMKVALRMALMSTVMVLPIR